MKSLHKVLDVIETVAREGSIGIRELSARTGFPPATIHRMTSTLVERRYLKQDAVSKRLSLSIQFLELGTRVQQHFSLT
ncbi:MAG: winged helix-turn-helix transcriptional regulator, partial [Desulfobacteraceae bacterium]